MSNAAVINPFATVPGFAWLGTVRMRLISIITIASVFGFLLYLLTGVFTDPTLQLDVLSIVFILLFAATFGSWVHDVRAFDADLQAIAQVFPQALDCAIQPRLYGSKGVNIAILVLGMLIGVALHVAGRSLGSGNNFFVELEAFSREVFLFDGPAFIVAWDYIAMVQFFIIGISLCFGVVGQFRQTRVTKALAQEIPVDLLFTLHLTVFGNPLLRSMIGPVVVLAATGPFLFVYDGAFADGFYLLSLPLSIFLVLLALPSGKAILILRRRIIKAKQAELDLIEAFLNGNDAAMQLSRLGSIQCSFSAIEVLEYRDRIRAVWNWPLDGQLPKILFYLIIPPLAWAAAALMERVIDASLT